MTMTQEELQNILDALCQQNGFDYAKFLGEYNGERIYKPSFNEADGVIFGMPCYLHVKGSKIRRSKNHKEVSKIMHYFFGENDG